MTVPLAVTRLRLAQFRSYERLDFALAAGPVAIFGPNGAGKTNLIEAISLLVAGRGLRGVAPSDMVARGRDVWRIEAEVVGRDGGHLLATRSEGAGRSVTIDGKPASQSALGGVARMLWLTPAMDRLWLDAAAERRRFLDRVTLSLHPAHGEAAAAYERALRDRNRLLRDGARDTAWFEALEGQMAGHGARIVANRRATLERLAAQPAAEQFPFAELTLEREGPDEADALAAALRAGRLRDMAAGRSLTGPHRDDLGAVYAARGMAARLCSTGEQKAMLVSLILAAAQAVAEDFGAAPVLLLDEIAAHLDADRRAALFAALDRMGLQVFMTGARREAFDGLSGAALVEAREDAGRSCVKLW